MAGQPNFHPISMLYVIADAIRGCHQSTREQLEDMRKVKHASLDDATLDKVRKLYEAEKELYPLFSRQLGRWLSEEISHEQRKEVLNLQRMNIESEMAGNEILEICEKFKDKTIEKLSEKDNLSIA